MVVEYKVYDAYCPRLNYMVLVDVVSTNSRLKWNIQGVIRNLPKSFGDVVYYVNMIMFIFLLVNKSSHRLAPGTLTQR